MKATYKLMIVCAKIKYPICIGNMQEHIWEQFIRGLIKQESRLITTYQSNDYDRVYMLFQRTKIVDSIVNIDNKQYVETQAYYFIQCKYIGNKLENYEIQYKKYPKQYIRSNT